MCFSAEASFGAAIGLTGIGAFSLTGVTSRRQVALAAVPLLFAAQQACEGFVWRVLEGAPYHVASSPLERAFLFFALFVWPPYVPLALSLVEPVRARRKALRAMAVVGAILGAYLMGCASLRPSNACIAFGNLYYWVQVDAPLKPLLPVAYLSAVAASLVVSSRRGTSLLAFVVVASFGIAAALYRAGFASVWCFFAALMSGLVALDVRIARRGVVHEADNAAATHFPP
jgi:hypothetical protein